MSAPSSSAKVRQREAKANPFGNYSLKEAQQPAAGSGVSGSAGGHHEPPRPALLREAPFFNYNFQEAQHPTQPASSVPEPSSPAASISNSRPFAESSQSEFESSLVSGSQPSYSHFANGPDWQMQQHRSMHSAGSVTDDSKTEYIRHASSDNADREYLPAAAAMQPESYDTHDGIGPQAGQGSASIEQYAIRMLYEEFRDRAASKIDSILELRFDSEPDLSKYLELGADSVFDRTLEKLGMLARRRPRVLIELLLVWRKTTIDATDEYPLEGADSISQADGARQQLSLPSAPALSRAHYIVKERRSLASVYILCRALSAVVEQLEASHLEGDLGDRLEELVFGQVKQVNPANLRRSQNRRQIQDLYARLIGRISDIRFASMSDRFIAELERIPMVSSGNDERIVVLLHNMRYLRMRVFPIDALEESSAFLLSCAKFYSRTSGSLRLKHAWATLLTEWLMPMAAVVGVEVNLPELVQAIDIIFAKAMKMAAKVRHVHVSFPLAAATLCISRRDAFHQRWLSLLEHCIQRLKDKQFRRVSMDAILRLLWVYLFRYPEPSAVVIRRIDSLSRIFFPATKLHAWPKMVPPSAFVYFLVCAACYNFDFAMRQLLLNMLQAEGRWLGTTREITEVGPALDSLNPARVGLAYQALVAMALIAGSRASPKSTNAGSSGDSDARAGGNNVVGSGSGPETASAGNGDSEMLPGKSQASVSLYPPFPGVGQLSGLDFFSMDLQPKKGSNALSTGKSAGGLKISGSTERGAGQAADSLPYAKATQLLSINPELLPENIRLALATATSIMQRYFNALNSMFGQYMLADERLWRLTRTVPPFSSVVLTGTAFSIENTATFSTLLLPDSSSHGRPNISHGSDSGAGGGGGGGGAGSGSGVGPISSTAFARGDGMSDGRYHDGIAVNNFGTAGTVDALLGATGDNDSSTGLYSVAASIRHAVVRYPAERQGYVDLMTVYTRIVPRVQTMLELNDRRKVVETMVQNVLSVDQALASESRACLLDLLCPVSPLYGQQRDGERVFASRQEQLEGIMHAVFRATQLLRAIDERYNEILVGGIFSRDARSSMSIAQPGDPLADELRAWPPSQQPLTHASARRFMHAANLSSGSTASNNDAGRAARGAISDSEGNADESWACHVTSASRQQRDDADSECDSGTSSAAASVAALDAKARLERSTWSSSTGSSGHELNGGFLHLCVDLLQYLEMSLCECQQGDGGGGINMSKKSPNVAFAAADDPVPAASSGAGQDAPAADGRMVGGHTVGEWARLVQAVEANAVALLCSSSARVRHAAVGLLYRAGALRLVLASNEPVPAEGHSWTFRGAESAYEVLNVMVPLQESTGGIEVWDVPFESADPAEMPPRQRSRPQQPLARLAASLHAADAGAWAEHFPSFVARASARMPEAMLVARTLVCQRLYQMQPLMAHYAEVPVRAGSGGSHHVRTTGTRAHAAAVVVRPDLTAAFGSLLLFAVISLPSGDQRGASGNSGPFGETVVGNRSPRNGSAFGSSRLAKSIARKLAPLKSSTRGSRLEHGTGLISITQLVRMAGALLRSDNAPLRQSAALALCHTPPAYLHELMLELRPLAESLFDDGSALASHRNYLHVSGISGHAAASGGGSAREGLLSALSHGLSASPGSATQSISGGSPRPPAQQIHRAGSGLLPTAQLAPHAAPKRRSNRAANTTLGRDGSGDGGHGSDTEATSDSGTQISRAGQGRRASSFDAASTTTGAVANTNASSAATAAANAAAIAAVSAGSGSASQIRRKRLRLSLAQIYRQVSRQLSSVYPDEQVLTQLISYIRETKSFLSESLVQGELEYQQLRIYFCGLVEALYYAISSLPLSEFASSASITESGLRPARDAPRQKFTFETRIGLYQMFERWCSLGRYADWSREAHGRMAAAALDPLKNSGERVLVADMVDSQKRRLEVASLRSMAVLCRDVAHTQTLPSGIIGNVKETDSPAGSTKTGSGPRDKAALFTWISDALDHPDTHIQRVGQRAVEWTIGFDPSDAAMVRVLVQLAYGVSVASSVASASAVGSGGSSASMDFQGMHTDLRNGSTSGLRLMFGGEPAAGASTAKTGASSVHVTLSTHRVALGYLRALTSILAPSRVAATLATPRSGVGKALSLEYASLVLPLVLFQLRSERHKIRRQALLLLRVLCTHMSVHSCLDKLDELGPSIVSDIPAIATSAASRLTVAVAASFAAHSDIVILECVRQVHMQGGIAARLTMLLDLLKPWLGHIELRTVTGDNGARLEPVALSRDTLVVLRCMLYLTTKAGLNSINCIHEMWMMLVDGAAQEANMWLVMRYLTGLLMHTQSVALLGYMRRIAVFLSRSSQGQQLVQQLVDEATRPSASVPIEADNVIAHNTINEVLPSEPWTTDFLFPPRHSRVMVSTGGLAIFYLGAISYEQRGLVAEHAALAALPPAVFCLAHPERWVRDAARTLLVNLAAGERAWCTASIATVAGGSNALADAAHTVLGILRSDECAAGFGNVEDELKKAPAASPADEDALQGWSPAPPAYGTAEPRTPADGADEDAERQCPTPAGSGHEGGISEGPRDDLASLETADPSLVADVANAFVHLSQSPSLHAQFVGSHADNDESPPVDAALGLELTGAAANLAKLSGAPPGLSRRSPSVDYTDSGPNKERATLQQFVMQLSRLFQRRHPGCPQEWAAAAVQWAMGCPVRPLAALALQIFGVLAAEAQHGGSLVITPTRTMVLQLVDRLSNVVSDPFGGLATFAETVLAGLRRIAALVARMCADDESIVADLLAASLALMMTAQSTGVYAMAISVFERMLPLVGAAESHFRGRISERIGALAAGGYQPALLRGLEFASCRERCLRLLRDTLTYDLGSDCGHPMLAITAHLPTLIESAVADIAVLRHTHPDTSQGERGDGVNCSGRNSSSTAPPLPGIGERRGAHRHNHRQTPVPSFTANVLGSSLGLMLGNGNGGSLPMTNSPQQQTENGSADYRQQASPSRRQIFRRRGATNSNLPHDTVATGSASPDSTTSVVGTSVESLPESQKKAAASSTASLLDIDRVDGSTCQVSEGSLLRERHVSFIAECSQPLLGQTSTQQQLPETRQFVQRLLALLAPSSDGALLQGVQRASLETIKQFGYAAVESGRTADIIAMLLRYLHLSGRARVVLKYLDDVQGESIFGEQQRRHYAVGHVAEEVRKLDVCLRLLQSVLVSSSDSATSGSSGGVRSGTLRLDTALLPSLRHLFDLLIVARPISDIASQVLQLLLQRFDEASVVGGGDGTSQHGPVARWYESDSQTLHDGARQALTRIVSLGMAAATPPSNKEAGIVNDGVFALGTAASTRSVSPEMPVLVIVPDDDLLQDSSCQPSLVGLSGHANVLLGHDCAFSDIHSTTATTTADESDAVTTGNGGDGDGDDDDDDLLAQLDEFDKELDEALLA